MWYSILYWITHIGKCFKICRNLVFAVYIRGKLIVNLQKVLFGTWNVVLDLSTCCTKLTELPANLVLVVYISVSFTWNLITISLRFVYGIYSDLIRVGLNKYLCHTDSIRVADEILGYIMRILCPYSAFVLSLSHNTQTAYMKVLLNDMRLSNIMTRIFSADHTQTLMALLQFRSTTREFTLYHADIKRDELANSK